jgi:hypothetical protein
MTNTAWGACEVKRHLHVVVFKSDDVIRLSNVMGGDLVRVAEERGSSMRGWRTLGHVAIWMIAFGASAGRVSPVEAQSAADAAQDAQVTGAAVDPERPALSAQDAAPVQQPTHAETTPFAQPLPTPKYGPAVARPPELAPSQAGTHASYPPRDSEGTPQSAASTAAGHTLYGMGGAFVWGIGLGAGAMVGLYLNPRLALEADASTASSELFDSSSKSAAIGARFHVTETFSMRGGLRVRHYEEREDPWLDLFDTSGYENRLVQTDVGVDIAVGHQWQWDHVVFGIDWLGFYVPLIAIQSEKQVLDPGNGEILERKAGGLHGIPEERALFIHLGVSG